MALNLDGYEERVSEAITKFWTTRETSGVRSGKTLDAFAELLTWVIHSNGLPSALIITGRQAQLPGYFRPTKSWDIVVIHKKKLIAAIEFKSIADSFGKNSNNRNEEALGSGIDIKEAFNEDAFEGITRLFTGYLLLVEDCPETERNIKINMKHFRAMKEFIANENEYNTTYIRSASGYFPAIDGVSYMKRFDILCRRLMQKQLYTAASVIISPKTGVTSGEYGDISRDTSIRAFLISLASHVETIAAIDESS